MINTKDGGPAFPQGKTVGDVSELEGGLSMRDFFAGKAMQGVLSNFNGDVGLGEDATNARISACAYAIADAMLKESAANDPTNTLQREQQQPRLDR